VDTNVSEDMLPTSSGSKTRASQASTTLLCISGKYQFKQKTKQKKSVHISNLPTHTPNPFPFCLSLFDHVSHLYRTTGKL
jgi:hypothetical protein